ncbi:hypothetical protein LCGC14_0963450 [marine sediment metagenome]|uniref:Terminase large subunit gp17-like C-terminal domain-containing protein n=1 Tax=marine sediment metagenome TaxID=412755 RepID=A0A0F9QX01_9ZZZZ
MQSVVFPRSSPYWPLPKDYWELTANGQRMSRVNATGLSGTPELEVVGWAFFRETYLVPRGPAWYRTGFSPSPPSHYKWVQDWHSHDLLVHAAPRGTCKTTVNLEDILRKIITTPYWECALFLATQAFCGDRLGRLMGEIENNELLNNDFGRLKAKRGAGVWNRGSRMDLMNGSSVRAIPITGAALGVRPSGLIVLDDVEKSDDLVQTPSDLRENFEKFFFNAIYPMARSPGFSIPIRIIGTLYNRRMFIYWLNNTDDSRVKGFWKRTLMSILDMNWEVMDEDWQAEEKLRLGVASFNAQYMNDPGTAADRVLSIHPELNTYWLEDLDDAAYNDHANSQAICVTHCLKGVRKTGDGDELPVPIIQHRSWSEVVSGMRRFITVDSSRTTTPTSDFSVVHVMGFENSHEHRDTLYSLDIWVGRVRPEELLRKVYQMAIKWDVNLVGVEAYNLQSEFYERTRDNLPELYGQNKTIPRVIPLKFSTKLSKADKIMQMEWRFRHFRMKLPIDRRSESGYTRLFYEVENFTEDMALLDHDDAIDTLAMHTAIGKQHKGVAPDIYRPVNLIEKMRAGEGEVYGVPAMSGINAADLSNADLDALLNRKYDEAEEEFGPSENWWMDYMPPGGGM